MAELNTSRPKQGKGKKVRSKKMDSRVDLTAMVDLAFLLITFFMLTTTLAKPQSMPLAMPDTSEPVTQQIKVAENRTVTLLLGTGDKLVWYMGQPDNPLDGPNVTDYGRRGLRRVLLDKGRQLIARTHDHDKGLIVIIKPSDKSNYRNLVDALDEMAISKVKTYAIVDISPAEVELLQKEGLD